MGEYTVKRIDEMEAVYLGAFKRARAELGVESFGLQVIDLPPDFENYPEHDHAEDGQEEVFMAIKRRRRDRDRRRALPARPRPHGPRRLRAPSARSGPGAEGMRMVIVGGVPGGVYEAPDISKLGEPDPMAS